jgi:hypothetical protein
MRNAHERSRRFELVPLGLSPQRALRHVERRAVGSTSRGPSTVTRATRSAWSAGAT